MEHLPGANSDSRHEDKKAMKTGRNDPCPCGSGKKYNKCCMLKKAATSDELDCRRLREVYDKLFDHLV
jgi:hypothetical protein